MAAGDLVTLTWRCFPSVTLPSLLTVGQGLSPSCLRPSCVIGEMETKVGFAARLPGLVKITCH